MLVHNLVVTGSLTFPTALPISGSLLISGSIATNGNVGVGTTNPLYRLHVANSAPFTASYFDGGTNNTSFYILGGAGGAIQTNVNGIRVNDGMIINARNGGIVYFNRDVNADFLVHYNTGASTALFITGSTGYVGINTNNPTSPLHISAQSDSVGGDGIRLSNSAINRIWNTRFGTNTNLTYNLDFYDGTSWNNRLKLTYNGNVGLGVTPSTWSTGTAIEVGFIGSSVWSYGTNNTYLTANAYFNGAWYYAANGPATLFQQDGGAFAWKIVGSGTAGGAITWSQTMSIPSDNVLLLGTTSTGATNSGGMIFRATNAAYGGVIIMNHSTTNNTSAGYIDCYYNTSYIGGIAQNGGSNVSFLTSSDYRLKEDLKDFDGLTLISTLKVYDFKWKAEDSRMYGVIAHEAQEVIPYIVSGDKDEMKENGKMKIQVVDYSKIVPVLIKAVQELKAENDALTTRITALEN